MCLNFNNRQEVNEKESGKDSSTRPASPPLSSQKKDAAVAAVAAAVAVTSSVTAPEESKRALASLEPAELGCLLSNVGFAEYSDAFVGASVTGEVLEMLESNDELKELGITIPAIKCKLLLKRINEVSFIVG